MNEDLHLYNIAKCVQLVAYVKQFPRSIKEITTQLYR